MRQLLRRQKDVEPVEADSRNQRRRRLLSAWWTFVDVALPAILILNIFIWLSFGVMMWSGNVW